MYHAKVGQVFVFRSGALWLRRKIWHGEAGREWRGSGGTRAEGGFAWVAGSAAVGTVLCGW